MISDLTKLYHLFQLTQNVWFDIIVNSEKLSTPISTQFSFHFYPEIYIYNL